MDRLYDIKEVAEILHRTEKTVKSYIGKGLTVYEVGGRGYLVSETNLVEFLEKSKYPKT